MLLWNMDIKKKKTPKTGVPQEVMGMSEGRGENLVKIWSKKIELAGSIVIRFL